MQDSTTTPTPAKLTLHSSACPSPRPVAGKSAGRPPISTKSSVRKVVKTIKKKVSTVLALIHAGCQVPIFSYFKESFPFSPIFFEKTSYVAYFLVHGVQRVKIFMLVSKKI